MQRVIVTVKRQGEVQVRDLEVPAEVKAERLSSLIAQALRWDTDATGQAVDYEIMARPPGRTLKPQETLAEAGVWDGSWLVFQLPSLTPADLSAPVSSPPFVSLPSTPLAAEGPVSGWRPLGVELPAEPETKQEQDQSPSEESGFVWKRLD